jgi:hypothetical protein
MHGLHQVLEVLQLPPPESLFLKKTHQKEANRCLIFKRIITALQQRNSASLQHGGNYLM